MGLTWMGERIRGMVLPLSGLALAAALVAVGYRLGRHGAGQEGRAERTRPVGHLLEAGRTYRHTPIILFSFDALRADHVGAFSTVRLELTPGFDRLAQESILFRRAYTCYPATSISFPCLLTSRYVTGLDSKQPLSGWTNVLRAAGYRTAAITGSAALGPKLLDLSPYFQDYDFDETREARHDDDVIGRAFEWLDAARSEAGPFFLMVHIFSPHAQYCLSYDDNVRRADRAVSQFIEGLKQRGLYDQVILVVQSDHGESLQEHGLPPGHGWAVYDALVRVPLLVRLPGQHARLDVAQVVRTIDIGPTLLDLVGAPSLPDADGRSLRRALERGTDLDLDAFSFSTPNHLFPEGLVSITRGRWQAILSGYGERIALLYDIENDPGEHYDLRHAAPESQETFARLAQEIHAFQHRLSTAPPRANRWIPRKSRSSGRSAILEAAPTHAPRSCRISRPPRCGYRPGTPSLTRR